MNIPFLSYFKKKVAPAAPAAEQPRPAPVEKPSSERLSKTVMPHVGRPPSSDDAFHAAGIGPMAGMLFPAAPAAPVAAEPRRTVSFGGNGGGGGMATAAASRTTSLPPAVALALEPKVERAISLELSDVVAQMPEGLIRPLKSEEASGRILLKAAELERGMANGKPMVSVATIYQQVPEIFLRAIEPAEPLQVALPFQQVLEQFTSLQVRGDQMREQAVPQVETPFLRVTIEDNSRFGMPPIEPLQTGELPTVRVHPATAESIAAAEPEPAAAIRIQVPEAPPAQGSASVAPASAPNDETAPPPPTRIPFQLSPNGTDVPASGGVPASNGPSVPTSDAPAAAAPARIPFQISAPKEERRRKAEPWLTKESFATNGSSAPAAPAQPTVAVQQKPVTVTLPLHSIFQNLAPTQVKGDLADVPEDVSVELPFELIESQLASGRVMVPPAFFAAALPEEFRGFFDETAAGGIVVLPLHEVLKNLPAASLQMRDDQEEQEKGANFATPFSAKAEEDAKRFNVAPTPVAKQEVAPAPAPEPAPATPAAPAVESTEANRPAKPFAISVPAPEEETPVVPSAELKLAEPEESKAESAPEPETALKSGEPAAASETGTRTVLQTALDTDDELDAKSVVTHVGRMEGVQACAIMFADGLSLAGNLPESYGAEGLCAMAPSLLQRAENHMTETKLGKLRAMTLSCSNAAVTFLMHDNLCLAALHEKEELTSEIRERLACTVHELSLKYSHPV